MVTAWTLGLERGGWGDIEDIPYAWNVDAVNTVEHVRGVALPWKNASMSRQSGGT